MIAINVRTANQIMHFYLRHRSKYTEPMNPPRIDLATFCSNRRLFCRRTSAASANTHNVIQRWESTSTTTISIITLLGTLIHTHTHTCARARAHTHTYLCWGDRQNWVLRIRTEDHRWWSWSWAPVSNPLWEPQNKSKQKKWCFDLAFQPFCITVASHALSCTWWQLSHATYIPSLLYFMICFWRKTFPLGGEIYPGFSPPNKSCQCISHNTCTLTLSTPT